MNKIDFIVTWVDGSDENWINEKERYNPDASGAACYRYRTLGTLKYWFRAVEKYAGWVNKVHFVTWGHIPPWLNTECDKLNIVKHSDYIPSEYLPTFSSNPIELNLHRIEGLSEQFVYFNDDVILNDYVEPGFFFKRGLPCDFAYIDNVFFESSDDMFAHIQVSEANEIGKSYSYIKSFFKHPFKYVNFRYPFTINVKNILKLENKNQFAGIKYHHLASPFLKQTFVDAWNERGDLLDRVSRNRFRTPYDVCQGYLRDRQITEGRFFPVSKKSRGRCFRVENDNSEFIDALLKSEYKVVCINDNPFDVNFEKASLEITGAYETKLPDKSSFEI